MNINDLILEGRKALKENRFLVIPAVMNDIITACDEAIACEKSQAYEYAHRFDGREGELSHKKIQRLEKIKAWAVKNKQ